MWLMRNEIIFFNKQKYILTRSTMSIPTHYIKKFTPSPNKIQASIRTTWIPSLLEYKPPQESILIWANAFRKSVVLPWNITLFFINHNDQITANQIICITLRKCFPLRKIHVELHDLHSHYVKQLRQSTMNKLLPKFDTRSGMKRKMRTAFLCEK